METGLTRPHHQRQQIGSNVALTTDEKYFWQLDAEYTIKQYEELKLKDTHTNYEGAALARYHIGNALVKMYEVVGLKKEQFPSAELGKRIVKYIQKTFPYICPGEVITAVEFGLQGKFPTVKHDGKSIFEHYGTMDLIYVNDVLQAYVKFRYDKKTAIQEKIENPVPVEEQIIKMLVDDDKNVKELIKLAFQKFKDDPKDRVPWLRDHWFEWLVDCGIIKYDAAWLNKRYKEIKENKLELLPRQCQHEVRVDAIYKAFEELTSQENPFEIFDRVTYINFVLLGTLYQNKKKK